MAKTLKIQNSCNSGEWSSLLNGRSDLKNYQNACSEITNYIVTPYGGVIRRPGTYFVKEVKDSSKTTRLFRFVYSTDDAYILEFGEYYIRFYKDGACILVGSSPYEVTTPYAATDLAELSPSAQSADILWICHPNYAPRELLRKADDSWLLREYDYQDGPYQDSNTDPNFTLTPSAITGLVTDYKDVVYAGGSINLYVAVGTGGKIATSADCVTWTERTSSVTTDLNGINYCGTTLIAVGAKGVILTSTNATTWTARTSGVTDALYDVTNNSTTLYVVSGYRRILTSPDLATWTSRGTWETALGGGYWGRVTHYGLCWTGSVYVSCGTYYNSLTKTYTSRIYTSPDGTTWTQRLSFSGGQFNRVNYDGSGMCVAVGNSGVCYTAPDPTSTWTSRTSGVTANLEDVVYLNSKWLISGDGGCALGASDPTSTWTAYVTGVSSNLNGIAWVTGVAYCYVGSSSTIVYTADLSSWTATTTSATCTITSSGSLFIGGMEGIFIRIKYNNEWGCAKVVTVNSPYDVTAKIYQPFQLTTASNEFMLGFWSDYHGWPTYCSFHEQRLYFGGCRRFPETVWATEIGDYYSFAPTITGGGDNYANDSGFNNATAGNPWTVGTGWSISGGSAIHAGSEANITQALTLTSGKVYRARYRVKNLIGGTNPIRSVIISGATTLYGVTRTHTGEYCDYLSAPGASCTVGLRSDTSVTVDYFYLEDPTTMLGDAVGDDSSLTIIPNANTCNAIRWLYSLRPLLIGTNGGVSTLNSTPGNTITPTNLSVRREAEIPASTVSPVCVGNSLVFVERGLRRLWDMTYDFGSDSYQPTDLTILAEHVTKGQIDQIAIQTMPFRIVWIITKNGNLAGLTYEKAHNVIAWHQHTIGGTDTAVKSVAVIPGTEEDEVWMIVSRTIDGATKQYIEYMKPHYFDDDIEHYFGVDCGLSVTGANSTMTLAHLEGETVDVVADGLVQADKTVSSSTITLATASVRHAHAGLHYDSYLRTMNMDMVPAGGIITKARRNIRAMVKFYQTCGGKIGHDSTTMQDVNPSFTAGTLASVDGFADISHGWDDEAYIAVQQTDPMPSTILCLVADIDVSER